MPEGTRSAAAVAEGNANKKQQKPPSVRSVRFQFEQQKSGKNGSADVAGGGEAKRNSISSSSQQQSSPSSKWTTLQSAVGAGDKDGGKNALATKRLSLIADRWQQQQQMKQIVEASPCSPTPSTGSSAASTPTKQRQPVLLICDYQPPTHGVETPKGTLDKDKSVNECDREM